MWTGGRSSGHRGRRLWELNPRCLSTRLEAPGGTTSLGSASCVGLETSPEGQRTNPTERDSTKGPVTLQAISSCESRNSHSRLKDINWP